jgi:hypothetical protein
VCSINISGKKTEKRKQHTPRRIGKRDTQKIKNFFRKDNENGNEKPIRHNIKAKLLHITHDLDGHKIFVWFVL